jgi:sugar phosphate isomerase/epimerase
MEEFNVFLSQLDAAFPLSLPEGATLGVEYVLHSIRWAKLAGCSFIDTTDDRNLPEGMSEAEALAHMKCIYQKIVRTAELYDITINVEPHGFFTTKPEFMEEILTFCDSPNFGMNMDTGNTYIAGQDPLEFLTKFRTRVNHVHIKDVSASLAAEARGELTGIAVSHSAIGDGVNAENIVACLNYLRDTNYSGVLSLECEGQGGPMLESSLAWVRETLKYPLGFDSATVLLKACFYRCIPQNRPETCDLLEPYDSPDASQ